MWTHRVGVSQSCFRVFVVHLSCSGNLLGDTALLSSLNETKAKALTVSAALADGKRLASELDKQRSVYRQLAARGSALYFSMLQLRRLDNMYCFSLTVCTCSCIQF